LFEKQIYHNLRVKNPKHIYDPNYLKTEHDKNFLFNNDDEEINIIVNRLKNPSISINSKLLSNNERELYQKYKVNT